MSMPPAICCSKLTKESKAFGCTAEYNNRSFGPEVGGFKNIQEEKMNYLKLRMNPIFLCIVFIMISSEFLH